ncbi:MAG: hypothetical protein IJK95_02255 [Firmicutes bacterium]|nr:hypothetical protein [Bacillota bacterium]
MTASGRKKLIIAAIIFLILCTVLYFRIYVAPKVSDIFVEDYTVEYGTLDVDAYLDYLCIRNEYMHYSEADGTIERKAEGGDLVRIGDVVVEINGYGYATGERGLVSYHYDGLEDSYYPSVMSGITPSALEPQKDEEGNLKYDLKSAAEDNVANGEPIYKIIDSHAWYLMTFLPPEEAMAYEEGSRVTVELDDEEKTQIRFMVYYNQAEREAAEAEQEGETESEAEDTPESGSDDTGESAEGEGTEGEGTAEEPDLKQVIFSCDRFYENEDCLRYGTARVITRKVSGIILDTSSIVEEDGVKGVYVKNKYDEYVFTRIKIIDEVGDKTVVESRTFYDPETDEMVNTVKNYDSVKKGDGSEDVNKE